MARLDRTVSREYIMHDHGGQRFTHYPSGETLLRHPWMRNSPDGEIKWAEMRSAFFAKHLDLPIVLENYVIVGHADEMPNVGRPFEIGEELVLLSMDRDRLPIDRFTVVGVEAPSADNRITFPDSQNVYALDNGAHMFWSDSQRWVITGLMNDVEERNGNARLRRPVEDDFRHLPNPVPFADRLTAVIPQIIRTLAYGRDTASLWQGHGSSEWMEKTGVTKAAAVSAIVRLSKARESLVCDGATPERIDAAVDALRGALPVAKAFGEPEAYSTIDRYHGHHAPWAMRSLDERISLLLVAAEYHAARRQDAAPTP